ncbi:uncharacterized protein PAC_03266 [Phialocephala subalpina]|uniref:Uncharacterized protein n=1 Tax=Phialocephala subalpina TaxID=576137 RepID=A0A1L7WKT0_9HELO|nr:uncharacterized protein PAC_03266 [Phialocephala subalpina]
MVSPLRPAIIVHLMRSTMFSSPDIELPEESQRLAIHRAIECSFTYPDHVHITHILSSPKPRDIELTRAAFAPVLERGVRLHILPPLSDEYVDVAHNGWSKSNIRISQVVEQLAISGVATLLENFDGSRGEEKREMIEVAVVTNGKALSKMVGRFQPSYWGSGRANKYIIASSGLLVPIRDKQLNELREQHPKARRRWFAVKLVLLAILISIATAGVFGIGALAVI